MMSNELSAAIAERDKLRRRLDNIMGYDRPDLFAGWSESDQERYAQSSPAEIFNENRQLRKRLGEDIACPMCEGDGVLPDATGLSQWCPLCNASGHGTVELLCDRAWLALSRSAKVLDLAERIVNAWAFTYGYAQSADWFMAHIEEYAAYYHRQHVAGKIHLSPSVWAEAVYGDHTISDLDGLPNPQPYNDELAQLKGEVEWQAN
jgi:hypothetical protein